MRRSLFFCLLLFHALRAGAAQIDKCPLLLHGLGKLDEALSNPPSLSPPEERNLVLQVKYGNGEKQNQAKHDLVLANLPLVVSISKKYLSKGMALEDLVGEGIIGLLKAVDRFDPEQNVKFSTYAFYWIKREILESFEGVPLIALEPSAAALVKAYRRTVTSLKENGRGYTFDDVVRELGLVTREIKTLSRALGSRTVLSLQGQRSHPAFGTALYARSANEEHYQAVLAHILSDLKLARLTSQEEEVIRRLFVDDFSESFTASMMGLARKEVSEIQQRALKRIRELAERLADELPVGEPSSQP